MFSNLLELLIQELNNLTFYQNFQIVASILMIVLSILMITVTILRFRYEIRRRRMDDKGPEQPNSG